ncbi:hypothetical protein Cflav_PD6025 [Pedosphaera parvula Ellin514]|uniref:Uncharacterized protein n=1 Tax=Pedosphaera parvula (strain Ellin514) TaxID=320771 RepID=B9XA49_PEDPL|nr:hypothetical protein Cflav_PD6025 [Pedosphaera parvula Ellin514]
MSPLPKALTQTRLTTLIALSFLRRRHEAFRISHSGAGNEYCLPFVCRFTRLEGEVYHTSAPITWAATNGLPPSLMVYKTVPQSFSKGVVSNAMALGSFKPTNLIPVTDKGVIHF